MSLLHMGTSRRYWEDLSIAAVNFQLGHRSSDKREWDWLGERVLRRLKVILPRNARRCGLRSWEFWRTVPLRPLRNVEPLRGRDSDDPGRSWLSTVGFRVLGGVAPYFPVWVALLFALPLFVWLLLDCTLAGRQGIGIVTLLLFASSTYAAELLTLPYSAAGFYLVGLLLVVVLGFYAYLATPTRTGLLLRWLLGGLLFAICALCRGSVRAYLPVLGIITFVGAYRATEPPTRRRTRAVMLAFVALTLLVGPYFLVRPPQRHEVWVGIWEGLGDFDREKGHAWYDPAARAAIRREGYTIPEPIGPYSLSAWDAAFRRMVLRDIADDPLWFLSILARRVPTTVLQLKLWPRASIDGVPFARSTHPAEGVTDVYYNFVHTADVFGCGPWTWELPLAFLWAGPVALVGLVALQRWRQPKYSLAPLGLLATIAAAGGTLPILVSTASGPETQAFLVVYIVAAGMVVDIVAPRWSALSVAAIEQPADDRNDDQRGGGRTEKTADHNHRHRGA
jgi:hypothetical protein